MYGGFDEPKQDSARTEAGWQLCGFYVLLSWIRNKQSGCRLELRGQLVAGLGRTS